MSKSKSKKSSQPLYWYRVKSCWGYFKEKGYTTDYFLVNNSYKGPEWCETIIDTKTFKIEGGFTAVHAKAKDVPDDVYQKVKGNVKPGNFR